MSIFDNLNKTPATNAAKPEEGSFPFVFNALPESAEEMKRLPEASLDTPYKTAEKTNHAPKQIDNTSSITLLLPSVK